ncbi:MAG: mechanosensitive ion channel domain-containing protein [Candidatus Electrothrix sp. GW3-4]|uniref:mechanosensitive ion channel family protein n=1 Tax=Candidatus Electrothrix sp. GW3-4 TaxID=3126740 RepID=UPI0030CAF889
MEDLIVKLQEWTVLYGLKVGAAILILILGRFAALAIRSFVERMLTKSRVDVTLVSFLTSVTYVALMAFVVIAALSKLGIQTASFIAVLGAAGLAIGLALQGSLSNFAAGTLLIIFKPFKVGDYIEAAGTTGTVKEVGIFTTELRTPDNKKVIVPNAKASGDNIVNYTATGQRRIDMIAGVSYSDDLDKAREILNSILAEDKRILEEPAPFVAVLQLADSSVNFAVRPWVKTSDYFAVLCDIQEKIKKRFDAEGITIPFPQRDMHLHRGEDLPVN